MWTRTAVPTEGTTIGQPGLRRVADRYQLTRVLGRGGMGTVWHAQDELLGRAVAIKVIEADTLLDPLPTGAAAGPPSPGESPSGRRLPSGRALREARAASRLNHPGAVTVYDIIEQDGHVHLVMELIEAPTLTELVRAEGRLSPARAAAIGEQLLDVLDFAHAAGIVHRDVKPSNVMVLAGDTVKLTDFGIAWLRGDPQLTTSGVSLGSPMFMAPEQAAGTTVGPSADLWALGATMYYAVEGKGPFDREVPMAVMAAIMSQPPDPSRFAGPLEPALSALLVRSADLRPDGAVLRRLLSLARAGGSGEHPAGEEEAAGTVTVVADPKPTLEIGPAFATLTSARTPAPLPSTPIAVTSAATSPPFQAEYGSPEPTRWPAPQVHPGSPEPGAPPPHSVAAAPTAQHAPVTTGGRQVTVLRGLVAILTIAVVALSFLLLQDDSASPDRQGNAVARQKQNPAPAEQADDPADGDDSGAEPATEAASDALAPAAADLPSDGLGAGPSGRAGLRQITAAEVAAPGQILPKFHESVENPVGGYSVGVPQSFKAFTVGPTTFIERDDTMFRAGFEVHSYQGVTPWARLTRDEKLFAKQHAADRYTKLSTSRRWTYRGKPAAMWEFTWVRNGVLSHGRQMAFRDGPRTYTVLYRSADVWWLGGGSGDFPAEFEQAFTPTP